MLMLVGFFRTFGGERTKEGKRERSKKESEI